MTYSTTTDGLSVYLVLESLLKSREFVSVLRSVDSSRGVDELVKIMSFRGLKYEIINNNICITFNVLKDFIEKRLFSGFDEVWLFSKQFPSICLEDVPYSTGDAMFGKKDLDPKTLEIFEKVDCDLLLADGVDLCFAAREKALFDYVLALKV